MGIAADFVLIVVAGFLGGIVARAVHLPLLVGYVTAGVLVGPYTAGPRVVQIHDIELLAEIGVALLLFSLGLEVSVRDLIRVRRFALFGGSIQIVLTTVAAAGASMATLGMSFQEAIWMGVIVSLSSTMVVLKTLSASGMIHTLASRVMIGLLVAQDLAVIPILILLPQIHNLDGALPNFARSAGIAAAVLIALIFLGTRLLPVLLRWILVWGSRELFLVAVVATGIGVGYVTSIAGLSFALGAFIAGLVLSESDFSHQALSDVIPLRDIFGLLFFVTVGMLFDPRFLAAHWGQILIFVFLIFAGKSLIIGGLVRAFGYGNMAPWIVGLGLSQIGEFSFVLARTGSSSGALSQSAYNFALTCTVLTMALSPVVSNIALPLGHAWRRWRKPAPDLATLDLPAPDLNDHVVIAGYGRSGRAVVRVLESAGIPVAIVEWDHSAYGEAVAKGSPAIWGDVSQEEILRASKIEKARVIVVTMPDHATIRLTANRARKMNASIVVIARATRETHVAELRRLGVNATVQPEFEGGVEMVRQALLSYHYDEIESAGLISSMRAELYSPD